MIYQFEKELDENTSISWWAENRRQVNQGIRVFNTWQLEGCPADKKDRVLAYLAYAKRMSSYDDPGVYPGPANDYEEVFDRMEKFVNENS